MVKQRRAENELFYFNVDPFRTLTLKRRKLIQNLSYKVEISDSDTTITIESASILQFVISLFIAVVPLLLSPFSEVFILPIAGVFLFFLLSFVKLSALKQFKEEVKKLVLALD